MDLWSWGANTRGQLGHGFASEQISRPTCVKNSKITNLLSSLGKSGMDCDTRKPAIKIDGGGTQTLLCIDRTLLKIGKPYNNLNSGVKGKKREHIPVIEIDEFEPSIISQDLEFVQEIACGWDFNLILTSDNRVYSWGGDNKYGQLGRELLSSNMVNSNEMEEIPGLLAVKIAAGLRRAAAVGTDGHLYVWGDNSKSDLGVGNSIEKIVPRPTKVETNNTVFVNVKCGKSFTIALDDKGQFWGCGDNRFGQLGLGIGGGGGNVSTFTKLSFFSDGQVKVKQFKCGWNHVLILLDSGQVFAFGRNNFSQLGRSDDNSASHIVPGIPEKIISIAIGSEHNLALSQSGTIYCWGWNEHESCGVESSNLGDLANASQIRDSVISPTVLKFPEETGKIFLIACGAGNGFAVSSSMT